MSILKNMAINKATNYIIKLNNPDLPAFKQELLSNLTYMYRLAGSLNNKLKTHGYRPNANLQKELLLLGNAIVNETSFDELFIEFYTYLTEDYDPNTDRLFPVQYYIKDLISDKPTIRFSPFKVKLQSFLLNIGLTPELLRKDRSFLSDAQKLIKSSLTFMIRFKEFKKRYKNTK